MKRLSLLLRATAHDALEGFESSDSKIRRIVREATDNVTRVRTLTIEAVASEKRLGADMAEHLRKAADWSDAAMSAIAQNDDDQARLALGKKINHENMLEALKPSHEKAVANSESLKIRLQELELSLTELKGKEAALTARRKGAEAIREANQVSSDLQIASDIDNELIQAQELVNELEARNAAIAEVNAMSHSEIVFKDQLDNERIERELNEIRKSR